MGSRVPLLVGGRWGGPRWGLQARGQLRREGVGRGLPAAYRAGLADRWEGRARSPSRLSLGRIMWVLVAGRLERPPREDAAGERGRDR